MGDIIKTIKETSNKPLTSTKSLGFTDKPYPHSTNVQKMSTGPRIELNGQFKIYN